MRCEEAAYRVGLAYFVGMGVQRDECKGLYFLLLAHNAGHAEAIATISEFVSESSIVREDLPSWLQVQSSSSLQRICHTLHGGTCGTSVTQTGSAYAEGSL